MNIIVNGETVECSARESVADLLKRLNLSTDKIAVERNGEVAPRALHASLCLNEGDRIEIIHFIGGG